VSWVILGNYDYFGEVTARIAAGQEWAAVPICAIIGGVLGGFFSLALITLSR
jgi:hypothetical protein